MLVVLPAFKAFAKRLIGICLFAAFGHCTNTMGS